jgi:hypothetical protein
VRLQHYLLGGELGLAEEVAVGVGGVGLGDLVGELSVAEDGGRGDVDEAAGAGGDGRPRTWRVPSTFVRQATSGVARRESWTAAA